MNRLYWATGLLGIFLITACASPLGNLSLTPTSKGEQLTPNSKGEQKQFNLLAKVSFPLAVSNLNKNELKVLVNETEQPIDSLKWASDGNQHSFTINLDALPKGKNTVIDLKFQSLTLSAMLPYIKPAQENLIQINLTSSTLVAVARLAEKEKIRKLKDWSPAELALLTDLPELGSNSESILKAYQAQDKFEDIFSQAGNQERLILILDAFILRLSEVNL